MRKWREIYSLHFLILSLFPPPLSISYIKICHILSQNVKYGFFVANVTKNLTYALWGNNSGPNSLWGSSASCAGLSVCIKCKVNAKLFTSGILQCVAICEKSGLQSVAQQIWLRNMRGAPGLDLICGQTKALQWGRLRNINKNASKKKMDKIDIIHVPIHCQWYPHHQPRWHGSNMGGLSSCRGWWIMIAIRLFRKSCSQ